MSKRATAYMSDEHADAMRCANCGERIVNDPSHSDCPLCLGDSYYHPNLVDVDCSGVGCANGETEAEPVVTR